MNIHHIHVHMYTLTYVSVGIHKHSKPHSMTYINICEHIEMYLKEFFKVKKSKTTFLIFKKIFIIR